MRSWYIPEGVWSDGVLIRSTEEGTGPPKYPKVSWIGCQGDCADGMTPANQACTMNKYTCGGSWDTSCGRKSS